MSLVIASILAKIFKKSILLGKVPLIFKSCYVIPLIKKSILDPSDVCSYRPISNLCLLKASGTSRARKGYLNRHNLLPEHQFAYRQHHSTGPAVLRVSSDFLSASDHDILLGRLETSFGFMGALAWFRSYLADRSFSVGYGELASSSTSMTCGVPQGSVLGPFLFSMYRAELESFIREHGLQCHMYADDTQVYGHC